MKIITDLGIAKSMVEFLVSQGFEVIRIVDLNPSMTDEKILALALETNAILITSDKDFGDLVFYSKLKHSGILLLRIEDASGDDFLKIIKFIFEKYWDQIPNNFCVYKKGRFRIRK
jgi:predicted nuclease of predicted toxin-antitoxin system